MTDLVPPKRPSTSTPRKHKVSAQEKVSSVHAADRKQSSFRMEVALDAELSEHFCIRHHISMEDFLKEHVPSPVDSYSCLQMLGVKATAAFPGIKSDVKHEKHHYGPFVCGSQIQ